MANIWQRFDECDAEALKALPLPLLGVERQEIYAGLDRREERHGYGCRGVTGRGAASALTVRTPTGSRHSGECRYRHTDRAGIPQSSPKDDEGAG